LTLAALTARRLRQDREIEGSPDTPNPDKPSPPLPEPEKQQARALPQSLAPPMSQMAAAPSVAAPLMAMPMAAAPTVTFSGTVVRNGPRFALRETAGVLYPLDSAGRAWAFEGEDVRVTGKLDLNTRLLYVDAIEPSVPSMLEIRLPDAV
jgi:hypothetical protein